jgi:hypothetical protein
MFSQLIKSIEDSFLNFNLRRFLFLGFIFITCVFVWLSYDSITHHSMFSRLEKKTTLLQQLAKLDSIGLHKDERLQKVYDSILSELVNEKNNNKSIGEVIYIPSKYLKNIYIEEIIGILFLPFVGLSMGLFTKDISMKSRKRMFYLAFILISSTYLFALILPIIYYPFINGIIYFLFQCLALTIIVRIEKNFISKKPPNQYLSPTSFNKS